MAEQVTRFSVSLPADLLEDLDEMVREHKHANRSQAIADMVRDRLIEHRQRHGSGEMAGTITLIYDHHSPKIQASLTAAQHEHHHAIVSTLHVHLDHDNCLEVIVVRGKAAMIRSIADKLLAAKGVKHGKLTITSAGHDFPSKHGHRHHHE